MAGGASSVRRDGWLGQRGTRHERGYGSAWDKLRLVILSRDCYLCQPCKHNGRVTPATAVDHIKPKSQGGTDDDDNLQAICGDCHAVKTAAEAAQAQGRKPMLGFDGDGCPVWGD